MVVFNIIVACSISRGIGYKGTIPWYLPCDLKYFSKLTKGDKSQHNALIMGRKTWESLPNNRRPLVGRTNVIISRNNIPSYIEENCVWFNSIGAAVDYFKNGDGKEHDNIWIIGGGEIYNEFINKSSYLTDITNIYITEIEEDYICDTYFPNIPDEFNIRTVNKTETYKTINSPDIPITVNYVKYSREK
jgi:dihydrofolate reductase